MKCKDTQKLEFKVVKVGKICLVLTTVDIKIVERYVEGKDKGHETGGSDVLPL